MRNVVFGNLYEKGVYFGIRLGLNRMILILKILKVLYKFCRYDF